MTDAERALQAERQNSTKLQEQVQELDQSVHEFSEQIEQQQQTISLLVSEKASLTSAVERLEHTEQGSPLFYGPRSWCLGLYLNPRSSARVGEEVAG